MRLRTSLALLVGCAAARRVRWPAGERAAEPPAEQRSRASSASQTARQRRSRPRKPLPSQLRRPRSAPTVAPTEEATVADGGGRARPPTESTAPSQVPTGAAQPAGRVRPDRVTVDQDARPADAEHGQSRRSRPWWGGDPTVQYPNEPAGGDDWEVSDPYSDGGLRGRDRLRDRERDGLHARPDRLGPERSLRAGIRARPQAVRLPHGPDLDPAQARAGR